jgi:hypothetical protein
MRNAYAVVNWLPILQRLLVLLPLLCFVHELSTPLTATPWLFKSCSNSSRSSSANLRTVVALTPAISANSSALTLGLIKRVKRSFAFKGRRVLNELV